MENKVFFYVDGEPCKGCYIDMDSIDTWKEVKEELIKAGYCNEEYDGDILVADSEGLCTVFVGNYGTFSMQEWSDIKSKIEDCEEEAYTAFCEWLGSPQDYDYFTDCYRGEADSELSYATDWADETMNIPDYLLQYFDYESFARDLFINDFHFQNGFVFSNS